MTEAARVPPPCAMHRERCSSWQSGEVVDYAEVACNDFVHAAVSTACRGARRAQR